MAIDKHTPKLSTNSKYFYLEIEKKLLKVFNKKKLTKIPDLRNLKKIMTLVE